MVMTTKDMSGVTEPDTSDSRGEIRYDETGLGYWYSFKEEDKVKKPAKVKKSTKKENPVEIPVEEPTPEVEAPSE